MAKRGMKKRGGFIKKHIANLGQQLKQKLKAQLTDPKSFTRRQLYKDGFLRTKGLNYLDKAAGASEAISALHPAIAPYAEALQATAQGARAADQAARAIGYGKRKGKGKRKSRKSRK
jgi:hypothetical protein